MQIWECQNPQTTEPINTEFGMGDYVGHITSHAKIHTTLPHFHHNFMKEQPEVVSSCDRISPGDLETGADISFVIKKGIRRKLCQCVTN